MEKPIYAAVKPGVVGESAFGRTLTLAAGTNAPSNCSSHGTAQPSAVAPFWLARHNRCPAKNAANGNQEWLARTQSVAASIRVDTRESSSTG
jgi:hypothetical protein